MRLAVVHVPVGKFVTIGIRVVQEATFLDYILASIGVWLVVMYVFIFV